MRADVSEAVKAASRLPSAPGVALRLVERTRSDDVSPHTLTELVGLDPVLAARLLKAANSPSWGDAPAIGSLSAAAERIGPDGVKAIALSFAPVACGTDAYPAGFDLKRFWQWSLACAVAASAVAEQTQSVEPDEACAAGLLCGFGRLVLATTYPAHYERVADGACTLLGAEAELLGTTHLAVAAQLFVAWRFPKRLCEAIAALAEIDAQDATQSLAHVLFAADSIAERICASTASGGRQPPDNGITASACPTDQPAHAGSSPTPAAEAFKAARGIDSRQWSTLVDDALRRWRQRRQLLEIPANGAASLGQIDAEARERLAELALTSQSQLRTLARRQDELLRRARTDPLTSVGNRPAFDERFALELDRAQRTGRPIVLLLTDVDRFKQINDRHGHAAGDEVLRSVARAMQRMTRSVDLVARYGGDEFAVIAAECTLAGARKLAERLRKTVEKTRVECNGRRIQVSISIGAALARWPDHAATPEALFAAADEQLYAAKHAGRNCTRVCGVRGEAVAPPHRTTTRITRNARHASRG